MADLSNLKNSRGGSAVELSEQDNTTGPAGLYRHPNGTEVICLDDPLYGNAQAEGLIRVGFEYVREAKEGEVKVLAIASLDAESQRDKVNDNSDAVKGIMARLNAVEAENAKLRAERTENADETTLSGEQAKTEAAMQTLARGTDNSGPVEDNGGVNAPVAPIVASKNEDGSEETPEEKEVREQREAEQLEAELAEEARQKKESDDAKLRNNTRKADLLEIAEKEGVEVTEELDTNQKLADAIIAKREESENK